MHHLLRYIPAALVLSMLLCPARADTIAPPGIGTAGWWIKPCELFVRQVTTQKMLHDADLAQAALCQGLFTGVMSVNYIDPPYLPFCKFDNDTTVIYARTFFIYA